MKAVQAGLAFGPSRALLSQLLPAPGQGPGDKTRRTGFFRMQIPTRTPAGARYLGTIAARGESGYAATSVMFGETALRLALDRDHLPDRAGVLTLATAMGAALTARLRSEGHTGPPARSLSYRRRHPPLACPAFTRELRVHRGRLNAIKKALDRTSHVARLSAGATATSPCGVGPQPAATVRQCPLSCVGSRCDRSLRLVCSGRVEGSLVLSADAA